MSKKGIYKDFDIIDTIEYIIGRGTIVIIRNEDCFPIGHDKSYIIVEGIEEQIPILGIEGMMTLMTIPRMKPEIGIIVNTKYYNILKDKNKITIFTYFDGNH